MFVEESGTIGSHSKKEGMSEIHLTRETRKQIPTRCKYSENTGEREDAQDIGIFGEHGQEEKEKEKNDDSDPGGENKHFVFENGKQLSQIK
jgi:hypothetical protein